MDACFHIYSADSMSYCMKPESVCNKCTAIKPGVISFNGEAIDFSSKWKCAKLEYAQLRQSDAIIALNNKEQQLWNKEKELISRENSFNRIRAKASSYDMNFKQENRAQLIINYDTQSPSAILLDGIRGRPEVSLLVFPEEKCINDRFFVIVFAESRLYISGELKKCEQNDYLFKCFERAGVCFDDRISRVQLQKAFRSYFFAKLHNSESTITINTLNGWDVKTGKFIIASDSCENIMYIFEKAKVNLPKKRLTEESFTTDDIQTVVDFYKEFHNRNVACLCFIIPFAALIRSIIKYVHPIPIKPLVIVCDSLSKDAIRKLLITYDQGYGNSCETISLTERKNEIVEFLADAKDELVVASSVFEASGSTYKTKKLYEQIHEAICIANGLEQLPTPYKREFMGYLVILSDCIIDTDNAYVIEWNDKDSLFIPPRDSLSRCWKGFTDWIENNWQKVLSIVRNADLTEFTWISVAWNLVCRFWGDNEYELVEEPDWKSIFCNDIGGMELLDIFKDSVINNCNDAYISRLISYKNYYGFKAEGFEAYLARVNLAPYKSKVIKQLKDAKQLLREDSSGNTYRLKDIYGNRAEYYLIMKSFFDEPGEPALKDIIKGGEP